MTIRVRFSAAKKSFMIVFNIWAFGLHRLVVVAEDDDSDDDEEAVHGGNHTLMGMNSRPLRHIGHCLWLVCNMDRRHCSQKP